MLRTLRTRWLDWATMVCLGAAIVLFIRGGRSGAAEQPNVRDTQRFEGDTINLRAVYGEASEQLATGDRVRHMIVFFRHDCPACQIQKSSWFEVADANRRGRYVALTIDPSESDSIFFAQSLFRVMRMPTTSLFRSGATVGGVPTTLLTDQEGHILFAAVGIMKPEEESRLRKLLASPRSTGD